MPVAALEVEIINKVTNLNALTEEKAALQSSMGGLQTQNAITYGGQLTKQEEAYAAAQLMGAEATKKSSAAFKEFEGSVKNATIISGEAGSVTDGLARKMSALGSLGITPASIALIGGVMALAGMVEAGKSMIDNADKQEAASKNLAQAYKALGTALPIEGINTWINANAKFLPSMYKAEDAFASLARAGVPLNEQIRLMNIALDLSVAKNIDLGRAVDDLIKLKTGRASQEFAALGIQIKGVVDPTKELTIAAKQKQTADEALTNAERALSEEEQRLHDKRNVTKNDLMHLTDLQDKVTDAHQRAHDAAGALALAQSQLNDKGNLYSQQLDQVEAKVKDAHKDTSGLKQSSSELSIAWEKLSNDNGPGLSGMLGAVEDKMAGAVGKANDFLDALRNSEPVWGMISKNLTDTALGFKAVTGAIESAYEAWNKWAGTGGANTQPSDIGPARAQSRAARGRGFVNTRS